MSQALESVANLEFELSGGALCLDFANTWGDRGRPETDLLTSYPALLAFAVQAQIAETAAAERLLRAARADPARARRALAETRELREAVARLFAAHVRARLPEPVDLDRLNRALARGLGRLRLELEPDGYRWGWDAAALELDLPLGPIARSAAELLTSPTLSRVRECDGVGCTWLFLDESRSRSRRWCSMASCGNRAKARRHYRRRRSG